MRRTALLTTTLAMTTMLAGAGIASAAQPAAVPTVESTTERVLQSVAVSMGPDGSTTGVGSSVVRTDGSVEDAETADETYSPSDVVGDLPVRVLTSWRTSEGAGTDLSDLQGYSGRIAIDLTVQNLTVTPKTLTYDAAGSSHQRAALVGSPLTVTASTALGDLKAERVVTDDKDTGVNVTNGVVGEGADGTTVQWAALLAPPVLSPSTEMSLVVDAKDFDVPTFDLSVQPGLNTDPSIGALVDAAFNPASSGELDLQRRTIGLITDVNLVLAKASDTISDVRTSLTSSAETLGTQTVSDLQASTQSVTGNMQALDGQLKSLQGDLSSTLEATGSSAVAELESAVQTVDGMLGDTSGRPPEIKLDGNGCQTTVRDPKQGASVFGSLLQVAGQLEAYSQATDACRSDLQASILEIIGDPDADSQSCRDVTSVTCALVNTRARFDVVAEDMRAALKDALGALNPALYGQAVAAAQALVEQKNQIAEVTELIDGRRQRLTHAMERTLHSLRNGGTVGLEIENADGEVEVVQVPTIVQRLNEIDTALRSLNTDAQVVRAQMVTKEQQARAAAGAVCGLVGAGRLTAEEGESIRDHLVSYECGQEGEQPAPAPSTELQNILDQTNVDAGSEGAALALANARDSVDKYADDLEAALRPRQGDPPGSTLNELFEQLQEEFDELDDRSEALEAEIRKIEEFAADLTGIEKEIDDRVNEAKHAVGETVDESTDDIVEVGAQASTDVGEMFTTSVNGLSRASDTVVKNGRQQIRKQKSDLFAAQAQAGNRISSSVEKGLGQINTGVTSSTRDMEAATTLLVADLRKVLLDLGERREGGGGLLGAMATNAATARTADFQLGLANDTATSYANVRSRDIDGLMLRQAQTESAMQMLIDMPAFQLDLPSGSQHRTVYSFNIGDS